MRGKDPIPPKTTARDCQKEYVVTWAKIFYWLAKDKVDPYSDEVEVRGKILNNLGQNILLVGQGQS
jgi:hypothetical protein